jgi:FtsP/CotA-like multicopper oxidase with cupredoxin domain
MTVIANDFVPITPYQTDTIFLNMGQRYDVIVKADQTSSKDFWMRAIPQAACSTNTNQLGIKGIVHYADSTATPTTDSNDYTDACVDEPMASLIPALAKNAGAADIQSTQAVTLAKDVNNYFFWQLDGAEFIVKWDDPMLLDVHNNDTTSLKAQPHVIELPTRDEWFYLLITETGLPITHPIHLHGHDFFVVGQGTAAYTGSEPIQAINPPRRDVATLPAGGWLMLAWKADNPGAWLAHCHIGWHTLQGFALQFLELEDEINSTPGVVDTDQLPATCNKWNTYAASFDAIQGGDGSFDSGL